jgi:predicted RNA-binding Zn ribbon-like protein
MNDREQTESWSLVAGHVALDFVNTVGGNTATAGYDAIATYELLLVWSVRVGTLDADQAERLRRVARRRPDEAAAVLSQAHRLRNSMYAVFDALRLAAAEVAAQWTDVRLVVVDAVAAAQPVANGTRLDWSWAHCTQLEAPLYPIAAAAAELATSELTAALRRCGRCRWLFLDQSKNRRRRWCDMNTCGVAEKVERQAERRAASRRGG